MDLEPPGGGDRPRARRISNNAGPTSSNNQPTDDDPWPFQRPSHGSVVRRNSSASRKPIEAKQSCALSNGQRSCNALDFAVNGLSERAPELSSRKPIWLFQAIVLGLSVGAFALCVAYGPNWVAPLIVSLIFLLVISIRLAALAYVCIVAREPCSETANVIDL